MAATADCEDVEEDGDGLCGSYAKGETTTRGFRERDDKEGITLKEDRLVTEARRKLLQTSRPSS